MKLTAVIALAAATVVAAQAPTYNSTTGEFNCPIANGTYCAGDSLSTNIIIRCIGFVGYSGNCDDNLDGDFPFGLNYSPCWASASQPGVAACSKNCIVYGGSGNYPGDFTLPNCVPSATPTGSSAPTLTSVPASSVASMSSPIINSSKTPIYTTIVTSIFTTVCPSPTTFTYGSQTYTVTSPTTLTITNCPCTISVPVTSISATAVPASLSSATISGPISTVVGNNSITAVTRSGSGSATGTPVNPTTSRASFLPSSANANTAGVLFAAMGLIVAYLL